METWLIVIMVFLAVITGYLTASIILFKFPNLLHKRKSLKFKPRHISHRGGAGEHLENTMTAFREAQRLKTDMFELDCHITADGVVVVSHDNSLVRTCNEEMKISETKYEDLPPLRSNMKVDFQPGFLLAGGDDRCIPTLRDVFTAFPTVPINIDIKIHDDELIKKVHELIVEFDREDLCIWGSRQGPVTKKLKNLNPRVPMFFSGIAVVKLILMFYSGILPFVPLHESALEIMMPHMFLMNSKFNIVSKRQRFLLRVLDVLLMRKSLFNHLRKRGIHTFLWVLNDEQEFDRAFQLGATGVMTDFPTKLRQYLDEHVELSETNNCI